MNLATDPRLFRYCRRRAARYGDCDAEDLAAEGVLGVLRVEEPASGPAFAFACTVARHRMAKRFLSRIRDRRRSAVYVTRRRWDRAWVEPPSDDDLDVEAMLAGLSERERRALWLGVGLGWSWASVGLVLDCSPHAAAQVGRKALRRVRMACGISGRPPRKRPVR